MAAKTNLIVSFVILFALAFPLAMATKEKAEEVVVEGKVYCQSCEKYGSWSLSNAKPIPSAKVSVICKDRKTRVSFYKVFETDSYGYFYAELKGFKMGNHLLEHPLHACKVRLVSSPLATCNELSNVNLGLYGAPLRYKDKKLEGENYQAVIYAAGPLAFRPAHCAPK